MHAVADGSWWTDRDAIGLVVDRISALLAADVVGLGYPQARWWLWTAHPVDAHAREVGRASGTVQMVERIQIQSTESGLPDYEQLLRWSDGEWAMGTLHGVGCVDWAGQTIRVTMDVPSGWPLVHIGDGVHATACVDWCPDRECRTLLYGHAGMADWYDTDGRRIDDRDPRPTVPPPEVA